MERCFIASEPDVEETHGLFRTDLELAHALIFVLSRLPERARRTYADTFYKRRRNRGLRAVDDAQFAVGVALMALPLTQRGDLDNERIADLLTAIQQGDDLSLTPPQAVAEVRKAVARARLDVDLEDELDPRAAATIAVVEVLDPSGGVPAAQEVLMRATWAVLETSGHAGALEFLLAVDALSGSRDDEQ